MVTVKTRSTEDNLCRYCQNDFPTCPPDLKTKFGNGKGHDNVIQCSNFVVRRFHNTYPIEAIKDGE